MLGMDFETGQPSVLSMIAFGLAGLYYLAVILPLLSVTIRRFHDRNLSGWWYLAGVVALAAFLALWLSAPETSWNALIRDSYLWHVVRFSFWQAFLSALFSVLPAIFLARALYRRRFPGRTLLLRLCAMTLILPVLVAVFGILSVYGRQGWLASLFGQAETPNPHFQSVKKLDALIRRCAATLNEKQLEAVRSALQHSISLISGGAGSGKSYTISVINTICEESDLEVVLAAPTGKAANAWRKSAVAAAPPSTACSAMTARVSRAARRTPSMPTSWWSTSFRWSTCRWPGTCSRRSICRGPRCCWSGTTTSFRRWDPETYCAI